MCRKSRTRSPGWAAACAFTRSTISAIAFLVPRALAAGAILPPSSVRMGRMLSRPPSRAEARPMRPPFCRYSRVPTEKSTIMCGFMASSAATIASRVAPWSRIRAACRTKAASPALAFWLSTTRPAPWRPWPPGGGLVGARHAARDGDGEDLGGALRGGGRVGLREVLRARLAGLGEVGTACTPAMIFAGSMSIQSRCTLPWKLTYSGTRWIRRAFSSSLRRSDVESVTIASMGLLLAGPSGRVDRGWSCLFSDTVIRGGGGRPGGGAA
jgi:hypothetical protein